MEERVKGREEGGYEGSGCDEPGFFGRRNQIGGGRVRVLTDSDFIY